LKEFYNPEARRAIINPALENNAIGSVVAFPVCLLPSVITTTSMLFLYVLAEKILTCCTIGAAGTCDAFADRKERMTRGIILS
jgi:hypothetical protein